MELLGHRFTDHLQQQFGCSQYGIHYEGQQQRQGEHVSLEYTEQIGMQFFEQNHAPCSEQQRMKHSDDQSEKSLQMMNDSSCGKASDSGLSLGILIPTIVPHLDKRKVLQLQLHFAELRRKEINIEDFMRVTREIAGRQLLQWALDSSHFQIHIQPSSATTPHGTGRNAKTSLKRRYISQKEPPDAPEKYSSSPSCKKRKVSGSYLDQKIGEVLDSTTLSGASIREEKQVLDAHRKETWISEAAQEVVHEEKMLILQKRPLQRKLAKLISKYGIMCVSDNLERCLSMCVEKRMRGLISNLLRLSKMRSADKLTHKNFITSDVSRQCLMTNQKAKEGFEQHQAEYVKTQKLNEVNKLADMQTTSTNTAIGTSFGDDDMLLKWQFMPENVHEELGRRTCAANRLAEDNMLTIAANNCYQTADGGDNMLLKWQLMAEQARQKRDGRMPVVKRVAEGTWLTKAANTAVRIAAGGDDMLLRWQLMVEETQQKCEGRVCKDAQPDKDESQRVLSTSKRPSKNNQEPENRGSFSAPTALTPIRKSGKNPLSPRKLVGHLSIRDLISILEREPQMSRSTLLTRLIVDIHSDTIEGGCFC